MPWSPWAVATAAQPRARSVDAECIVTCLSSSDMDQFTERATAMSVRTRTDPPSPDQICKPVLYTPPHSHPTSDSVPSPSPPPLFLFLPLPCSPPTPSPTDIIHHLPPHHHHRHPVRPGGYFTIASLASPRLALGIAFWNSPHYPQHAKHRSPHMLNRRMLSSEAATLPHRVSAGWSAENLHHRRIPRDDGWSQA